MAAAYPHADYLPTQEVADLLRPAMERLGVCGCEVDRRAGYAGKALGTTNRVLRVRHRVITVDLAERLLDVFGIGVWECPTYERIDEFNAQVKKACSDLHKEICKENPPPIPQKGWGMKKKAVLHWEDFKTKALTKF